MAQAHKPHQPQVAPLRCTGFPVELGGFGERQRLYASSVWYSCCQEGILTIKQATISGVCGGLLFIAGVAIGQQNVNPKAHPHLAAAQHHISEAQAEIDQARASWADKLGGHAENAKTLLQQADGELKQAASYADKYK